MSNKKKGEILEDLVALMHEAPGVTVETRKLLPALNSPIPRNREIDVLITTPTSVGYPVRIAIQCKNEAQPIGIDAVDSFFSSLNDVGIPPQLGILVSTAGYTRDAQASADAKGIRTLVFEGLTEDHLGQTISETRQSVLFLIASAGSFNRFEYMPQIARNLPTARLDSDETPEWPTIMNGLWGMWVSGRIQSRIGQHTALLAPKTSKASWLVLAELVVTGHTVSVPGTLVRSSLRNTSTSVEERTRIDAKFDELPAAAPLTTITSESELQALRNNHGPSVETRIRVPRLASKFGFWPPTIQSAQKAEELLRAGKPVSFEEVEGDNILRAWQFD